MPDPNGVWLLTLVFPSTRSILLKWNCAAACVIVEKNPHPQAKNSPLPSQLLSATWQEIWMLDLFKAKQSEKVHSPVRSSLSAKGQDSSALPSSVCYGLAVSTRVGISSPQDTKKVSTLDSRSWGGEGLLLCTYIGITYIGTQYINKPPSLLSSAQYWCSS